MKKSNNIKLIIVFIMLVLSVSIINRQDIIYNLDSIDNKNAMDTSYDSITDFQDARWTEIQDNIFGEGYAKSPTDTRLATAHVIEGNGYFNWIDTSSLGIRPWDGTSNKEDGTPYSITDFYVDGALPQEEVTYQTDIVEGVTDTRNVTYEVYNIDNANEFYYVLSTVATTRNNKKIYINNDIDLGGANNIIWPSIYTSSGDIYIEGNGHTIYNLNSNVNGIFSTMNAKTTIVNLNIKSVKVIGKSNSDKVSPIGRPMSSGYRFENVHIDGGFIQSGGSDTCGFISRPGSVNTFIKDCSTENMYIYGAGQHTSGFIGCISGAQNSFTGGYGVRFDVEYPDQPEAIFGNSSTSLNTSDARYPFYVTNCYSIDCEIFSTSGHSGGFISCMDSGLICKNSFCNNSIYGEDSVGVFIGCQVGYSWGPFYDAENKQTINAYFENCYTSGVVEGTTSIGGFVGSDLDRKAGTVYKNCYSTSMVGMDYSGEGVGGFIGSTANTGSINIEGLGNLNGIIMINCYAAGEVGNIDTSTDIDTAKNKKIGGFLGEYTSRANQLNLYNCYYDKQTTAMREIAVGMEGNGANSCELNGVTGVYTQESQVKGVQGLTNVDMQDNSAWIYKEGYYPQLKAFIDDASNFSNSELVKSYSTASTATVFLNHWDELMTENGNVEQGSDAKEIYDTIRDITSTFEFTSNENSDSTGYDMTWQVDSDTNATKGYVEELKITEEDGTEKTVPVLSIQNPVKNRQEGTNFGLEAKDIYKCYDFAPGKSWVKVEAKSSEKTDVVGTRKLRLLPTAYIDAGEYAQISLITDGNSQNIVKNSIQINGETSEDTTYKHAKDTMYVITDSENLGDNKVVYPGQIVSKDENTLNLFALWNRYPEDENASEVTDKSFDDMYNQALIGNSKDTGLAKVEVYNLNVVYKETEDGAEVPVINYDEKTRVTEDTLNDARWRGEELFDVDDAGWYELKYYWRLNDGRYLTDSKIVVIQGSDISATLNNRIIKGQDDYASGELKITPDIEQATENADDLELDYSKIEEDNRGVQTTVNENGTVQKNIRIDDFNSNKLIVGWRNDSRYKLEELKIEVSRDGAAWITLPIDLNSTNEAKYTYLSQNWEVKQYTDTKEYYIEATGEPIEVTLQANHVKTEETNYVNFEFMVDSQSSSQNINNSNIRVTATFVPLIDLTLTKEWVDNDNELNIRPTSVVLKAIGNNGKEYEQEVNRDTNWQAHFTVPQYNINEEEITYTVDEKELVDNYEKTIDNENYKVINSLEKYNITTKVNGEGGTISGQDQDVYEEVTYKSNSQKEIVITPNDGYEISKITINGVEQELPEYSLRDEPYTLNRFEDVTEDKEIIVEFRKNIEDIEVTKVWNDNSNESGKRPNQIKIILKSGINEYEQVLNVTDENTQSIVFSNMPKYDAQGNEIEYVADEEEVEVGDLEFYTKQINNFEITNTFTVPESKTSIEVTKVWDDNNNMAKKRPENIIVELRDEEGKLAGTETLNELNGWKCIFTNLAKYNENAEEKKYTIDEKEVNEGDLYFYTKTIDNTTHTITNTFTVPEEKISLAITKIWEDNNNETNARPEKIVFLAKNGENILKRHEVEVTEENEKEYVIEDLNRYDELGNEIEYTVDEEEVVGYDKKVEGNIVTNTIKKYKITTEVNGNGGIISGQNEDMYEEVAHNGTNLKDIIITPDEGYKISKITVNGQELKINNSGESYTLDKFVNITEDKHIVVEFESLATSVLVKHVDEEGQDLIAPQTIDGKVGDKYTTQAEEFENYELKEVIGNETGNMTKEQIVVTYVYSKVIGSVEITKVDKEDSNKVIDGATFKIEKLDIEGNVDNSFEAKELTTGEDGKAKFEGLEVGRYRVTEIKAPEGYELLKDSIEVKITKENRDVKLIAENELKLVLPETGAVNYAIVFGIIGAMLIISSLTLSKIKNEKLSKK